MRFSCSVVLAALITGTLGSLSTDIDESPSSPLLLTQLHEKSTGIEQTPVLALEVRKNHVFMDSLALLTDDFVESSMPAEIKLDGKIISPKEWIKKAAVEAGQLLFAREGKSIVLREDQSSQTYVAFGRLVAYGLMHEQPFGISFPETFFDELLDPNPEPSLKGFHQMKLIQKGFSHFYDIQALGHLWGMNFKQLFA